MFKTDVSDYLANMGMDANWYYGHLLNHFSENLKIFEDMILAFKGSRKISESNFNNYVIGNGIEKEGDFYDSLYDFFCCIRQFENYGKLELFRYRQPEWDVPRVVLTKSDFSSQKNVVVGDLEIFRGLSVTEFQRGKFGQSWTTNIDVAYDFAHREYNQPHGLIIKTIVKSDMILDIAQLPEYEVIVEHGSIMKSDVFIV